MWGTRSDCRVKFVDDGALPKGVDWVFTKDEVVVYCFIRQSAVSEETLTECWQAWQKISCKSLGVVPQPRRPIEPRLSVIA